MMISLICGLQNLVREKCGAFAGHLGPLFNGPFSWLRNACSHLLLPVAVQDMDETGQEKKCEFYFAVS